MGLVAMASGERSYPPFKPRVWRVQRQVAVPIPCFWSLRRPSGVRRWAIRTGRWQGHRWPGHRSGRSRLGGSAMAVAGPTEQR